MDQNNKKANRVKSPNVILEGTPQPKLRGRPKKLKDIVSKPIDSEEVDSLNTKDPCGSTLAGKGKRGRRLIYATDEDKKLRKMYYNEKFKEKYKDKFDKEYFRMKYHEKYKEKKMKERQDYIQKCIEEGRAPPKRGRPSKKECLQEQTPSEKQNKQDIDPQRVKRLQEKLKFLESIISNIKTQMENETEKVF